MASLPCYLSDNVDKMRGHGVYNASIRALQRLNQLGYGRNPHLIIDLVYNPPIPKTPEFRLTPGQQQLAADYKAFLQEKFDIQFNSLLTITNLPLGRTAYQLQQRQLYQPYIDFLAVNYNPATVAGLMCRSELSIDHLGQVYDCDFNQMAGLPARNSLGETLTVAKLLAAGTLDIIPEVQTAAYCYGCTAGAGSSCGGALL